MSANAHCIWEIKQEMTIHDSTMYIYGFGKVHIVITLYTEDSYSASDWFSKNMNKSGMKYTFRTISVKPQTFVCLLV